MKFWVKNDKSATQSNCVVFKTLIYQRFYFESFEGNATFREII